MPTSSSMNAALAAERLFDLAVTGIDGRVAPSAGGSGSTTVAAAAMDGARKSLPIHRIWEPVAQASWQRKGESIDMPLRPRTVSSSSPW